MPFLAGDQVANHQLPIALLRKNRVGQKVANVRQMWILDMAPAVVILVSERALVCKYTNSGQREQR